MFAIEARDFAGGFTLDGALFDVGTLVARNFALPDTELGFQLSVFPIKLQNNERAAFDLALAVKFVDLLPMKEKFAHPLGHRHFVAGFFVGLDVSVVEKRFAVFNSRECVADVRFAGAN